MSVDRQVQQNTEAIQKLINDAVTINKLPDILGALQTDDYFMVHSIATNQAVKVPYGALLGLVDLLFKESRVYAERKDIDVSGAYDLDWNDNTVERLTLTADSNFVDKNKLTGIISKIKTVWVTGAFALAYPSYYPTPRGDSYDGSKWNRITIDCIDGTNGSEMYDVIIENIG